MLSQARRFLFAGLSISLLLGNSAVFAQGGVVVPTSDSDITYPSNPSPSTSGSSTTTPSSTTVDGDKKFSCQFVNGRYTVMYQPESQPGQYFAWAAPQALGGGWTPEARCNAIAERLELYRPDGLQELNIARQNSENIICVTTEALPTCRIVLTVPRGKDPYTVRSSVFQNLISADDGQQTIAVNTFNNRNNNGLGAIYNLGNSLLGGRNNQVNSSRGGINLKPFLDPKDGGTARNLRNGVSINRRSQPQNNIRLNPGRFR
ncbi:hypothetical protein B6N60_04685 [Richelia sinica FACHB-800]|uniref:Circadian oscillating protein COP23 n=1 Tax=Richelia sinica FACHB-800 TaxID=1357546 RepID=A0A975Y748_9NOST|nr:COP23 domain-containing protein [Richelia sinica]MBD2665093.1 hypothetical protein [Richelia sinica FACHB-800]QXE25963.1 hypothetical protein B6N60_04685 [Richelia sinica FACHB-800]